MKPVRGPKSGRGRRHERLRGTAFRAPATSDGAPVEPSRVVLAGSGRRAFTTYRRGWASAERPDHLDREASLKSPPQRVRRPYRRLGARLLEFSAPLATPTMAG